jgi:hypothetical protein
VNAHGNVSVIECANPGSLIDVLNVFQVSGPPPKGKQQKGNLTCFDNDNASFNAANVQGNTSGDGSCID